MRRIAFALRALAWAGLLVASVAGCGDGEPPTPQYDFGGPARMKAGVVVLPDVVAQQSQVTTNGVDFPRAGNDALLQSLKPGAPLVAGRRTSVLASNNALGMLRKVVSVTADDATIHVETAPATLADVFEGDFNLSTSATALKAINPAGLDVVSYYFGDDPGVDLADCDASGVCKPKPDDGSGVAPKSYRRSNTRKSPLFSSLPARYAAPLQASAGLAPAAGAKSLTAGDIAANPAAVGAALSDVVAVRTRVRAVAEQGLDSFSQDDTQKLFRIMARNFADQGDTKDADAATTIANYVANPAQFATFKAILRQPVSGTLATKGIFGDILNGIATVASDVVNAVTSLLDVDVTLSLGTIGRKKDDPYSMSFLAGKQVKQLGKAEYAISTEGDVSAYAYVSTQAHFDGHVGVPSHATFWLGGDFGAGAAVSAQLKASLQSTEGDENLAADLLKNPTRDATPWSKTIATLGPYEGPSIGPVPTAFSVELTMECSWSLYGQVQYDAAVDFASSAKLGASISTDSGWSKIADFDWNKTFSQDLLLGGGAEVECGLNTKVDWLVADAVGPYVTLEPGVKAEATYSESCDQATGHSPDAAAELSVKATLASEVGATVDFAGFDLGDLAATKLLDEDWDLYSSEKDWPGAGYGYCSISCDDGRQNGNESDVDCGGDCSAAGRTCKSGQACNSAADCAKGGSCLGGKCADPAYCSSGVQDGDETDVDCGGSCIGCPLGKACTVATDCASLHCDGGACVPATCSDAQRNGAETDVDCGSADCIAAGRFCALGAHCTDSSQCAFGNRCVGGACTPPASCANGILDPGEASWDCGGPCPACADGSMCTKNVDCTSGVCDSTCQTPSCTDHVRNADETDVDCGGSCSASGARCGHGKACKIDGDCVVNDRCQGGVCVPPAHCYDGKADAGETDVDCGGTECFACGNGHACAGASDCLSASCLGGVCQGASCGDRVLDQDETDVDCGGACDGQYKFCRPGQRCKTNVDCGGVNGNYLGPACNSGVCTVPAACMNFVQDTSTNESDVDCGGSCSPCAVGKTCSWQGDCGSGSCASVGPDCLGSSCDVKTCQPAACDDYAQNGDETDVDCGGSCAAAGRRCAAGQRCMKDGDCLASNKCVTGVCVAPASCGDGMLDGAESDVDCGGGVCGKCGNGKQCRGPQDCASGACGADGRCEAASCSDRIKDGDEVDVDCGGSCGRDCIEGQKCYGSICAAGLTCSSYLSGKCYDHACDDLTKNGSETDVDCGGGHCEPCDAYKACNGGGDCKSGVCAGGRCADPSCHDGVLNGNETDVDCGGACGACGAHARCGSSRDCASGSCIAGACQAAGCGDGIRNGNETDVDCGGSCSALGAACAVGRRCGVDGDCTTGFCNAGLCTVSTCSDGVKHGTETDVDCGGSCSKCADGKGCALGADCTSGVCNPSSKTCAAPSCNDGVKNGAETALDCGGGCPGCNDLAACVVNADCKSRYCTMGSCAIASCNDGVSDGKETGVDCGGGTCGGCATGGPCVAGSDCVDGVCNGGACAVASCTDGVKNGTETDLDCGGPCVASGFTCAPGKGCKIAADCSSASCTAGVCDSVSTCSDGKLDGTETDVDCGGACSPCGINQKCRVGSDCQYNACVGGLCTLGSCTDGIKDGYESDVDCGGNCSPCATGKRCLYVTSCVSGDTCVGGFCTAPSSCADGVKDGAETDVDCGGGNCSTCAAGKTCGVATDCQSIVCTSAVCATATCSDGVKNQDETDVDCGGSCATAGKGCAVSKHCAVTSDCASPNTCIGGVCTAPATCSDGIKNQNETDIDCGGVCAPCLAGKGCAVAADCSSLICTGGFCASATCSDRVKNGAETDVDCGGPTCSSCANGLLCAASADCQSLVCSSGRCATPSCTDGVKNQNETGIDCGGSCDAQSLRCINGVSCIVNNDCQSLYCAGGTCASGSCNDGIKNGTETDVDCGGGACPTCATGKACVVATDCTTVTCTSLVCAAPACSPTCGTGAACGVNTDCASGTCTGGKCAAPACGPTCADGQGCASNADCASGLCKANLCVALFGSAAVTLTPDSSPWSVQAADLDGDGKLDLAVTTDPGNLDIFYGNGGASFAPYVLGPNAGHWPTTVGFDVLDVTGDGKPDLLTDGYTAPIVYPGNGARTYAAPIGTAGASTGTNDDAYAKADFNKDGKIDVVATYLSPPEANVYLGNGNGTFGSPTALLLSGDETNGALATGDLDGDGSLDLVASVRNTTDNKLYLDVFKGNGAGGFGARASFLASGSTGAYPSALALGDLTGDGKLDALLGGNGTPMNLLVGNGDGTFQTPTTLFSQYCDTVVARDFDGDGHLDAACSYWNGFGLLLGTGGGSFKAARTYVDNTSSANFWSQKMVLVDVDGDGDLDAVLALGFATAPLPNNSNVFVLLNQLH